MGADGIRAVFLDVGETIVDETGVWESWADWLGVPRFTFMAVLGQVIERGGSHTAVFEEFRPGFDLETERAARAAEGRLWTVGRRDLYPDVLPCLERLRARGFTIGIAGNQPAGVTEMLQELGLPVDVVATSADWGVEKPSPAFFERVAAEAGVPAARVAYVGDRLDNDVLPAQAAGMFGVFLRRGPWGYAHARRPLSARADVRIDSLAELPEALAGSAGSSEPGPLTGRRL